jgi:hypothetical protein
VRFLQKQVQEAGLRVALLHGERSQEEREAAMADFRSGKAQVCEGVCACWVPVGSLFVGWVGQQASEGSAPTLTVLLQAL